MKAQTFRGLTAAVALSLFAGTSIAQVCPEDCIEQRAVLDEQLAYLNADYPEAVGVIYACALAGAAEARQQGLVGDEVRDHVMGYVTGCALVYCIVDSQTCEVVMPELVGLAISYSSLEERCTDCAWEDEGPIVDEGDDWDDTDDYYGDEDIEDEPYGEDIPDEDIPDEDIPYEDEPSDEDPAAGQGEIAK